MSSQQQKQPILKKITKGLTVGSVITGSTFFHGPPVLALGLTKLFKKSKKVDETNINITNSWLSVNNWLIDHVLPETQWDITVDENLDLNMQGRYLMTCNHQSWVDTTVNQYFGLTRMPLTRFFTKWELIFIPFVGQAFKILGFPMMKRHTKEQIAKNPELKTRDMEEARKACEQLLSQPFTLLNYLEGTRFTPEKHAQQQSPFTNLLKAKAGGLALALNILGDKIDALVDMTIVYPDGAPGYGEFWLGEVPRIVVNMRKIEIPEWVLGGNYEDDAEYRERFQNWVDDLWTEKDQLISAIKQKYNH
ncbi:acyltransferase [Acinetobacter guillouiae]|jgi:1-acyl-sn-glycerol-3-phosphate acyltransferase|uniref:acyltransferase n=1 Tax=Acinetobacter TaxID=469 RepID=UPI000CFFFB02|nr:MULTISPECIES: acyltransferase [Acinetobacter]MCS4298422.1 1-acyl-sn-glycerol-3-phosphate acyltransferase [Acinetobacter guillouiae]MCW2252026.1 1-acyl-sn-glycerol-3-phosphate acyltransferase [Acinetobacter sp. BIGb0204]NII38679.1 1-acyl-sn-glycerol-3-phosphate acyltransferase [Acinetobacter sp. BIGb0196]QLD61492.1 acyltransferase [Acinetobacter sp. MYb10]